MTTRLAGLALALWLLPVAQQGPMRVLFIGNSLTYGNDLPAMVASLGRAAGPRIEAESVALPDFSLEDHWRDGRARRAIARRNWTWVVLQQGPSARPESRVLLIDYARRFDAEIRRAGARTALYMVWPPRSRSRDFPNVSQSYAAAAATLHATLIPAGDAWQAAWQLDAELPLYGPDGFHPSVEGSWLAALVTYHRLAGRAAPSQAPPGITADRAALLHRAAVSVVTNRAARP